MSVTPARLTARFLPRHTPRPLSEGTEHPLVAAGPVIGVDAQAGLPQSLTPAEATALTAALHRAGTPPDSIGFARTVVLGPGVLSDTLPTVVIGLGPVGDLTPAKARRLGSALATTLAPLGLTQADCDLPVPPGAGIEILSALRLRLWQAPTFRTTPADQPPPALTTIHWRCGSPAVFEALWAQAEATCEGVELARDLQTLPANMLTIPAFLDQARALTRLGVEVEILGPKDLHAHGMGLHLAVGQGSATPPALAVLRWRGGPAGTAPTLLVGKGLCFDTGGICIKPAGGMEEMKGDMGGAAAVIGTLHALARSRAPVNVTGLLALAENAIDGASYRPGDILSSHAGLTVEVIDTDAEGRLVLADALSWGCRTEKPAVVVDLATLTGSVVVTLGHDHAGLFTRPDADGSHHDDALAAALTASGARSGEPLWRLPLSEHWDDILRSDVADLRQCAPAGRLIPDALHAARFLSRFVPAEVPYAHLDIAGTADIPRPNDLAPRGATGFGVRLLMDWLTG